MRAITAILLLCAAPAAAQPAVTAAEATARTEQALRTVEPALTCFQDKQRQLRRNLELIREAEAQRVATGASAAARRDAEETLRALLDRAAQLEREASGCWGATGVGTRTSGTTTVAPPAAGVVRTTVAPPGTRTTMVGSTSAAIPPGARTTTTRDAQGREVIVVEPPPDPAADSVARNAPAIESVDSGTQLTPSIRIVSAERVDGPGRISATTVATSVRSAAPRIDACYHEMVRRGGRRTGTATVAFTITSSGRIRGAAIEAATLGDSTFNTCMRTVFSSLHMPSAQGEYATFSYDLSFGSN